jgi:hypothetical protein
MTKTHERVVVFVFGIVFIVKMLVLAVSFPQPTFWQYQVFRIVLALAAGIAAMLPGSIEVTLPQLAKTGGALALFVLMLYQGPAQIVESKPEGTP